MNYLRLAIIGLPLLLALACSQQPTDDEIRAMVKSEVEAAISEVKQGPPGEQGPLPSNEILAELIQKVVLGLREDLRGPQGLQGEQGPLPSNEILAELIQGVVLEVKEDLRGPQGLRGEQGPPGARGPQGVPGTAQLSQKDRATLNRVNTLESDLRNLRSEVECEVGGSGASFICRSSLHGFFGNTIDSRISSLENELNNLRNRVNQLERNAHRHTFR